ncbi:TIR domain-containing protein [Methylovorus mays]|uniref:TIR domain-containing protein n=1 Tax=Methylovorus mays TaxID=184077 RepID=UPI001E347781|nr:TIR domain-containing protein [Methylovorus mays]MCB5207807.1 TIR domain-containing protein [Methylovorus mays]
MTTKKKTFISFDYDNDARQKDLLVGQSKNQDTPFDIADWSIKEHIDSNWKAKARTRIKAVDVVIILCGHSTNTAAGVSAELAIAQEEKIPYFLLAAYSDGKNVAPTAAKPSDKIYSWTWENLKKLIHGGR